MGVLLVASALSCRRHPLGDHADSGPPVVDTAVVDPGVDAPTDHGAGGDATDARAPIDTADAADGADAPDARDANDAGDANDGPSVPPVPCGALRALTAKGPFTSRHARHTKSATWILLLASPFSYGAAFPTTNCSIWQVKASSANPTSFANKCGGCWPIRVRKR